jgi:hypothetical protein
MDESRKRVLLIAASILAARKLAQYDGGARVPATISAIVDAIRSAEQIMNEIDRRWPSNQQRVQLCMYAGAVKLARQTNLQHHSTTIRNYQGQY